MPSLKKQSTVNHVFFCGTKSDDEQFIASIGTEKKYTSCVKIFFQWCQQNRQSTSEVTIKSAEDFLKYKAKHCVQKTVDGYRQSLALVFNLKIRRIVSSVETVLLPRAYSVDQIQHLSQVATSELSLAIRIAHAAGLRAIELDTLSRSTDTRESPREWLAEKFQGMETNLSYVVTGKGGLKRSVKIPRVIAEELELHRRNGPIRKTQRGIHYEKWYSIIGGHTFSQQFGRLSIREFGWSTGAHGLRHCYAQERMTLLQIRGFTWDFSLKIVSQELGHFSTKNTLVYMR